MPKIPHLSVISSSSVSKRDHLTWPIFAPPNPSEDAVESEWLWVVNTWNVWWTCLNKWLKFTHVPLITLVNLIFTSDARTIQPLRSAKRMRCWWHNDLVDVVAGSLSISAEWPWRLWRRKCKKIAYQVAISLLHADVIWNDSSEIAALKARFANVLEELVSLFFLKFQVRQTPATPWSNSFCLLETTSSGRSFWKCHSKLTAFEAYALIQADVISSTSHCGKGVKLLWLMFDPAIQRWNHLQLLSGWDRSPWHILRHENHVRSWDFKETFRKNSVRHPFEAVQAAMDESKKPTDLRETVDIPQLMLPFPQTLSSGACFGSCFFESVGPALTLWADLSLPYQSIPSLPDSQSYRQWPSGV